MNKFRVWWIPQVPGEPFITEVKNFVEGKILLDTLAKYDLFQLDHNIKPDFANAGGLQYFDEQDTQDSPAGSWSDWHPSEKEHDLLESLFGDDIAYSDDPLDQLTLEQVRKFQAALDKVTA